MSYLVGVFIVAALANTAHSVILHLAHRAFHHRVKFLEGSNRDIVSRAISRCDHCKHYVASYFIDGAGRTTCPTCKPEGFADAVKRKMAVEK